MNNQNNELNNFNNANNGGMNNNFPNVQPNQNNMMGNQPLPNQQPNLTFQMPESVTPVTTQQPQNNMNQTSMPQSSNNMNSFSNPQPMQQPNSNMQMNGNPMNGNPNQFNQNMNPYTNLQPTPNNPSKNKTIAIVAGVVAIAIVAVVAFLLLGSNTLTCSMSDESDGMKMTTELKIKHKKESIKGVELKMTVDLGKNTEFKEYIVEQYKEMFSESEYKNVDVKVTSDKSKIYVTMRASEDDITELGLFTTETLDEIREELEDEGYTCK